MTFFEAVKAFFTPEERVRRHLTKAQVVARSADYTIMSGVIQEVINAFERGYEQNEDFPDWVGMPSNDADIQGMRDYLMWSATKSGWSSDRLHYIDILCKKAQEQVEFQRIVDGSSCRA